VLSTIPIAELNSHEDSVWHRLYEEGRAIAAQEPILNQLLDRTVLQFTNFSDALVSRLALRLGGEEVGSELLLEAFSKAVLADPGICMAAKADLLATLDRDPACQRIIDPFLYFKGWQALQSHRIAHQFWLQGQKDLAYFIQSRCSVITSVDIHPAARIGMGIMIDHAHDVVIGETCVIEDNVSLMQGVTLGGNGKEIGDRQPKIRQGVLIGAGAKVLGNIEIGRGSRVAAGSVVLHSVPANTTVAGVPARVVGTSGSPEPARNMDHQIEADEG